METSINKKTRYTTRGTAWSSPALREARRRAPFNFSLLLWPPISPWRSRRRPEWRGSELGEWLLEHLFFAGKTMENPRTYHHYPSFGEVLLLEIVDFCFYVHHGLVDFGITWMIKTLRLHSDLPKSLRIDQTPEFVTYLNHIYWWLKVSYVLHVYICRQIWMKHGWHGWHFRVGWFTDKKQPSEAKQALDRQAKSLTATWGLPLWLCMWRIIWSHLLYPTCEPWWWYIYLPTKLGDFVRAHVGKYSSTMEHMGRWWGNQLNLP